MSITRAYINKNAANLYKETNEIVLKVAKVTEQPKPKSCMFYAVSQNYEHFLAKKVDNSEIAQKTILILA